MFDTPREAWEEFEASRQQMENRLFSWDEMIGRYHGPYWDKSAKFGGNEPENPSYEWIATMKAQFIAGDPACTAKATRVDRPETRLKAIALRHTMNRLLRDSDDKTFWRDGFVPWCFSFDAFVVQRTPAPWADRGPLDVPVKRPMLSSIHPKRLRYDARATKWRDTRWRGYELVASKKAVLSRAKMEKGWRVKEIEAIDPESGDVQTMFPREGQQLKRDDFKMYIAWAPEEQVNPRLGPDKGFWGTVHFYAQTRNSTPGGSPLREIRDPQPYYGPRQGPIYMSGQESVPDSAHPLSVMVAIENLAKSLRLQSQVIDQAMRDYARFVIEGTGQPNVAAILKNAKHGGIVSIKGFDKNKAAPYVKGGVDGDQLAAYQFLLDRMDRRSGLSGTARGQAEQGVTATAEAIAQGGSAARIDGMRDTHRGHVRNGLRARAEIVCMDEDFYMPLDERAVQEMIAAGADPRQIPEYVQGGKEEGESFEDYELDIEPLSMRHQTQEEREMAAERELNLWTVLAEVIPASPFLGWKSILGDIGDNWNKPELPERVNYPMAEQVAGLLLMTTLQGSFTDSAPQKQPMSKPKTKQTNVIDITGSSKPAGQQKPQQPQLGAGMGAAKGQPVGKPSMPGNKSGARAGGGARRMAGARK